MLQTQIGDFLCGSELIWAGRPQLQMRHWSTGRGVGFHFELFSPWTWLVLITSNLEVSTDLMHTHTLESEECWGRREKTGFPLSEKGRGGGWGYVEPDKISQPPPLCFSFLTCTQCEVECYSSFFPPRLMSCSLKRVDQTEERVTRFFKRVPHKKSIFRFFFYILDSLHN